MQSAVTSNNWNLRADESLHKSLDPTTVDKENANFATTIDGKTSKFDTPSPVQASGFDLIQQGRNTIQMGRNLFVKQAVPSASNMNFIHRKGESAIQASEPFPENAYFQEDAIDVEIS